MDRHHEFGGTVMSEEKEKLVKGANFNNFEASKPIPPEKSSEKTEVERES